MSRINSGKMNLSKEPFYLSDLLHDTLTIVTPQMKQKHHDFEFSTENIAEENLRGDIQRLRQIYVNIINNSVKYTKENGRISVTISEEIRDDLCHLSFNCTDNGMGMSEEFLQRIFNPFERAGNSTISGIEGTGLGMSIVKKLVDAMNGTIDIKSKQGEGTSVTIVTPLPYEKLQINTASLENKRFLLVMSDQDTEKALLDCLNGFRVACDTADDLASAIGKFTDAEFENKTYDALLLGRLDDGAAFDLASYFRKSHPGLTMIYISEEDWEQIEYSALRSGIGHFIPLPFFRRSLINSLNEIMSGNEEEQNSLPDLSGTRILLAEDNFINREIALELLKATKAQIDTAENGQEALDKYLASEEGHYKIILMDIQMPVMDGYEATRKIRSSDRADAKTIKIYAMSANIFAEDIARSKANGMDGHIGKPIDINHLMQTLRQA